MVTVTATPSTSVTASKTAHTSSIVTAPPRALLHHQAPQPHPAVGRHHCPISTFRPVDVAQSSAEATKGPYASARLLCVGPQEVHVTNDEIYEAMMPSSGLVEHLVVEPVAGGIHVSIRDSYSPERRGGSGRGEAAGGSGPIGDAPQWS